jgi:hypothetical protein
MMEDFLIADKRLSVHQIDGAGAEAEKLLLNYANKARLWEFQEFQSIIHKALLLFWVVTQLRCFEVYVSTKTPRTKNY